VILPPDYVRRSETAPATTVDRSRLLLLVLEGGHAFLVRARAALAGGDARGFVADLRRTQDVLLELSQTLDRTGGGEIVAELGRLSELMVGHLALASAEGSLEHVDAVLRAYDPVLDAYRRIVHAAATGTG
jgi:flagellar biosynthetic protein FliS